MKYNNDKLFVFYFVLWLYYDHLCWFPLRINKCSGRVRATWLANFSTSVTSGGNGTGWDTSGHCNNQPRSVKTLYLSNLLLTTVRSEPGQDIYMAERKSHTTVNWGGGQVEVQEEPLLQVLLCFQ